MVNKFSKTDVKNLIEEGYSKSQICLKLFGNNAGKTYKRLDKLLITFGISPTEIAPARGSNKHNRLKNEYDLTLLSLKRQPMTNRQYRKYCFIFNRELCHNCFIKRTFSDEFQVEVHHIDGDILNNRIENLIPLCANCHKEEHLHLRSGLGHLYTISDYIERTKEYIKEATPKFENQVLNFTKPNELFFLLKTAEMIDYEKFTAERLLKLEKAFDKAVKEKKFQFNFEKKVIITDYAKVLIKHLRKTLDVKK